MEEEEVVKKGERDGDKEGSGIDRKGFRRRKR